MNPVEVGAYLDRIGYRGELTPNATVLRELHRAHLYSIPFEDLDIHIGRQIQLDVDAFYAKIVEQRRGGFCYELNGLFAELLCALGFSVTLLSAFDIGDDGSSGDKYDHLALRIDLDQPWLADVGFGDLFLDPIRLDLANVQTQSNGSFQIVADGQNRVLMRGVGHEAKKQYRFSLEPRTLADFAARCHYQQTSPESHFTRNRLCTRPTAEGRVTLSGRRLIITRDGTREESELPDEEAVTSALWTYFGVRLTD